MECLICNKEIGRYIIHHLKKEHSTTLSEYKNSYPFKKDWTEKEKRDNEEKLKDGYTYVKCELCNTAVINMKIHIHSYHRIEITVKEYETRFPNAKMFGQKYLDDLSERLKGKNNPNHKSRTTKEQRRKCSPYSKDFYKAKFPDLSDEEIKKIVSKNAKLFLKNRVTTTSIEYWINKGFSPKEAKEKLSDRQKTFTLEKLIKKHGEEKGKKIWDKRQEKWKKKVFNKSRHISLSISKVSINMFNALLKILKEKSDLTDVYFGNNEKFIKDSTGRNFKYDFTIKKDKKIIEFNGDYWHCNPLKYKPEYYNKVKKMTAKEIWQQDEYKLNLARNYGYEVLVIWEHDWMKNPDESLRRCIQFLCIDKK